MKTNCTRMVLALLGATMWLGTTVSAEGLAFSDMEQRLAKIEAQLAGQEGVQSASFLNNGCGDGCCGDSCCSDSCCGDSCCSDACCGDSCCGDVCGSNNGCGHYYAEVQINFLRAHVNEDVVGKLSEQYEWSPRFILGYEDACGVGARLRYWRYANYSPEVGGGGGLRFDFNVTDIELTNRFQGRNTDIVFAGGFRYASTDIEAGTGTDGADLIGLTMAVDLKTLLCCDCGSTWSWVYGGRVSILGGDWDGNGPLIDTEVRDDNVMVYEMYGGVEYGCNYCGNDIFARLAFEMQNWHSDVLGSNSATDSIGFIGPGFHFGGTF